MSTFRLQNRRKPLRHARKMKPTLKSRELSTFFGWTLTNGQGSRLSGVVSSAGFAQLYRITGRSPRRALAAPDVRRSACRQSWQWL